MKMLIFLILLTGISYAGLANADYKFIYIPGKCLERNAPEGVKSMGMALCRAGCATQQLEHGLMDYKMTQGAPVPCPSANQCICGFYKN